MENEDYVVIYQIDGSGNEEKKYSKYFDLSDKGYFVYLRLEDITNDGVPEIVINYKYVRAGFRNWGWHEVLSVLESELPYKTLFKHNIREEKGNVRGDNNIKNFDIKYQDINSNGINEIIVDSYEGKDENNLKKVSTKSEIYYLVDGKYQKKE